MSKKEILLCAGFIIVAYIAGFLSGMNHERVGVERVVTRDTSHVVTYDTIPYYDIIPRDSVIVRYETHVLALAPVAADSTQNVVIPGDSSEHAFTDSTAVVIPIVQKVYADSTYTAYVSGFNPSLDSIFIYQPTYTYTINTRVREKIKRWGIGPHIGVGVGKNGVTPYVGIGIQYNIYSF